jgi:hypothetical protein
MRELTGTELDAVSGGIRLAFAVVRPTRSARQIVFRILEKVLARKCGGGMQPTPDK